MENHHVVYLFLCKDTDGGGNIEKRAKETSMDTGAKVRDCTYPFADFTDRDTPGTAGIRRFSLTYLLVWDDGLSKNTFVTYASCLLYGLEYIGSQAFAYCTSLKNVYIPATVAVMPGNPFQGCTGVESFTLDADSVDFTMVDGVLYDRTMYTLIYYPASLTAEMFQIPNNVYEIGIGAFSGAQMKSIVLPDQITEIPAYAFENSGLENVVLDRNIVSVGDYAFVG